MQEAIAGKMCRVRSRDAGKVVAGRVIAFARRQARSGSTRIARLEDDVRMPAPAVKAVRQYRESRERIVAEEKRATRAGRMGPGGAPHGSAIEYCDTTPKSLASRVSAC